MTLIAADPQTWVGVCALRRLEPGRGVAALVDGRAVALFRLDDATVRAVDNVDPWTGASVLSRGLTGTTVVEGEEVTYVASPLRKQRFDLATGRCLDGERWVATWPVRVVDGTVEVGRQGSHRSNGPETTS